MWVMTMSFIHRVVFERTRNISFDVIMMPMKR